MSKIVTSILVALALAFLGNTAHASTFEEIEDNDNRAQATPMQLNASYSGILDGPDDTADYYKIELPADGELTAALSNVSRSSFKFYLYNDQHEIVNLLNTDNSINTSGFSDFKIGLVKGTYFLAVKDNDAAQYEKYTLKTSFISGDFYEKEPDGDGKCSYCIHYGSIQLNEVYTGYMKRQINDKDHYTFTTDVTTTVTIQISNSEAKYFNLTYQGPVSNVESFLNNRWYINSDSKNPQKELTITKTLRPGRHELTYNTDAESYKLIVSNGAGKGFKDVLINHPYYNEIKQASKLGIITGYSDGTYLPKSPIKRHHVSAMIMRSGAKLESIRDAQDFTDVKTSHPNYENIQKLYQAGIIDGNKVNRKFYPDDTLTRAQLAKILVLAYDLKLNENNIMTFKDVSKNDWYNEYVQILASHGITTGSNGYFNPSKPVTREHFAVFLMRTLNIIK